MTVLKVGMAKQFSDQEIIIDAALFLVEVR